MPLRLLQYFIPLETSSPKKLENYFLLYNLFKSKLVHPRMGKSPETALQSLRVAINEAVRSIFDIFPAALGETISNPNVKLNLLNCNQILQIKILQFMYKEHHRHSCMFFYVRNVFLASFI